METTREQKISCTQQFMIAKKVVGKNSVISLSEYDVHTMLQGKSGLMYERKNDNDKPMDCFMKEFFDELKTKQQTKDCSHILISILIPKGSFLQMDDMQYLSDFGDYAGEDKVFMWGIGEAAEGMPASITVLCTKEDRSLNNRQICISAPSGCGKTTLINYLMSELSDKLGFSVSLTIREPRDGEKDGASYWFVSKDEFEKYISEDKFLEYQEVYEGCYYGTLATNVVSIENEGKMPLFDLDVIGHTYLKLIYGDSLKSIFIAPPSIEVLRERLIARGTDSMEAIEKRIAKSRKELGYKNDYDYIVVNDGLEQAKKEILNIVTDWLEDR